MSACSFFDTNIFVYTDANDEPIKQARALELIEQGKRARSAVLSTQVLNEYFAASTRKLGCRSRSQGARWSCSRNWK